VTGKRERNKQQKYFDFLTVASRLFEEKGVENTTMLEIAAKSASVTQTLNRYFPTKNALVLALLKEDDRVSIKRMELKAKKLPDDPIEGIIDLFRAYVDYADIINKITVWREYESIRVSQYGNINDDINADNLRSDIVGIIQNVLNQFAKDGLLIAGCSINEITNAIHAFALLNYHKTLRGNFSSDDEAVASLRSSVAFIIRPYLVNPTALDGLNPPA